MNRAHLAPCTALLLCGGLLACSANEDGPGGFAGPPVAPPSDGTGATPSAGTGAPSDGRGSDPVDEGGPTPGSGGAEAGQLTAGAWDDNLNFDVFKKYRSETSSVAGIPRLTPEEQAAAYASSQQRTSKSLLDVALVVDTTGSMTDEIQFLRAEFLELARQLESEFPNADQRWALIAYGDDADVYVVDATDFESDLDTFLSTLNNQALTNGGDYPEASARALDTLNRLSWRTGPSVARLAFWVTDAPHHVARADLITEALRTALVEDIHIYPVAASGIDELAEHTMRAAAQLTGGRYLFLTDDSGIGDEHKEPRIPCYFVTLLQDAMLRMVAIELTGEYREPFEHEIIRAGGDPTDGHCTLEDGTLLTVF